MKYSVNWITTPNGNGIKAGDVIAVSVPEAKQALYCIIYEDGFPKTVYWDGFNEGIKDQVCHVKTIGLMKGEYLLVTKALADNHSGYATWYDKFLIV